MIIIVTEGRDGRTTAQVVRELVELDGGNHADVYVELGGVRTTDELVARWLAARNNKQVAKAAAEAPAEVVADVKPKQTRKRKNAKEADNASAV